MYINQKSQDNKELPSKISIRYGNIPHGIKIIRLHLVYDCYLINSSN